MRNDKVKINSEDFLRAIKRSNFRSVSELHRCIKEISNKNPNQLDSKVTSKHILGKIFNNEDVLIRSCEVKTLIKTIDKGNIFIQQDPLSYKQAYKLLFSSESKELN